LSKRIQITSQDDLIQYLKNGDIKTKIALLKAIIAFPKKTQEYISLENRLSEVIIKIALQSGGILLDTSINALVTLDKTRTLETLKLLWKTLDENEDLDFLANLIEKYYVEEFKSLLIESLFDKSRYKNIKSAFLLYKYKLMEDISLKEKLRIKLIVLPSDIPINSKYCEFLCEEIEGRYSFQAINKISLFQKDDITLCLQKCLEKPLVKITPLIEKLMLVDQKKVVEDFILPKLLTMKRDKQKDILKIILNSREKLDNITINKIVAIVELTDLENVLYLLKLGLDINEKQWYQYYGKEKNLDKELLYILLSHSLFKKEERYTIFEKAIQSTDSEISYYAFRLLSKMKKQQGVST